MARKTTTNTTTPTNKKDGSTQKVKPARGKKKGLLAEAEESAPSDDDEPKPLQATIGEALVAKGAKPVHEVQLVNFDRRLPCPLTAAELRDRALRMKEARRVVKHVETMLTNAKEEYDRTKKSLESDKAKAELEIAELADEIGDEATYRDVRCQRIYDYQLLQVREVRTDTVPHKQLQEPRPMTAREVEEGYTNADGARTPANPDRDGDDAVVDDDYGRDDDESDDDDLDIDFD